MRIADDGTLGDGSQLKGPQTRLRLISVGLRNRLGVGVEAHQERRHQA